ncbi:MAG TPA: Wzz/FepE/Etk N-terminal domain-containing protein [Terracidiphilus sp.]|nr:Wzz/FepE/Etk N-terminal domain-containing protein [Terracidiphilus sp.]
MATDPHPSEIREQSGISAMPRQATGATAEDEISLLDLLIVLAERKRTVLLTTLVFAVLSIAVSLLLPKRYTAKVTLLPPQQNSSMSTMLASQLGSLGGLASLAGGGLGLKNPNDMYVAMFKSETVEDAMVNRYGLMQEYHAKLLSDARKDFEHHATVDGNGKDGLIRISVEDRNPERAKELANGYVDAYRDLSQHLAITEAGQRALFFKDQLAKAKDNLAKAEVALEQTEQKTGLISVDSQARALIESAASLNAQIAAKEVQIQAMQTYATGQNSQLIQAEQELDSLRAQLAKLGGNQNIGNGIIVPKGQVPGASLDYVRRLRDVKYYQTIFDILAQQYELAELDQAKEGALIQVVDPAIVPDKRSFPHRALIVIVSTFAGFLIGIFIALVAAGMEHLKSDEESSAKLTYLKRALSWRTRASS